MDSYFSGREMTRPYTSGLIMADMSLEEIRRLTPSLTVKEMSSPFAKYYYEEMAPLQDQMKAAIEAGPLDGDQMYMPMQAGDILLSGSKNYPLNGYGVLNNGVGYSSMLIHQDGITDEMIANYRDNLAVYREMDMRRLFYKTWYPGKHLIHFDDGIVEDFGWGFCRLDMNWDIFNMEKHLGVKVEDIPKRRPDCIALIGLGGECLNIMNTGDKGYTCMVQFTTETDTGRDLCVHYWNGIRLYPDGSYEVCPNVDKTEMEKRMLCMMQHAMMESCNEVKHIKEFWKDTQQTSQ